MGRSIVVFINMHLKPSVNLKMTSSVSYGFVNVLNGTEHFGLTNRNIALKMDNSIRQVFYCGYLYFTAIKDCAKHRSRIYKLIFHMCVCRGITILQ